MEAGKKRLSGDTMREANTSEVKKLKQRKLTKNRTLEARKIQFQKIQLNL